MHLYPVYIYVVLFLKYALAIGAEGHTKITVGMSLDTSIIIVLLFSH